MCMAIYCMAMGQIDRRSSTGFFHSIEIAISGIDTNRNTPRSPCNPCPTPECSWIGIICGQIYRSYRIDFLPQITVYSRRNSNINIIAYGALAKIRYFERIYPKINIDGSPYSNITICGFRYQLSETRYFVIGTVMSTTDDSAWGPYVESSKILVSKYIDGWTNDWTSIN